MKRCYGIVFGYWHPKNSHNFAFMRTILASLFVCGYLFTFLSGCKDVEKPIPEGPRNLDSLLVQSPDSIPLLLERGNSRFDAYEYDLAMKDAAHAFRLDSLNLDARLLYAEVLNNREKRTIDDVSNAQRHYKTIIKKLLKLRVGRIWFTKTTSK